MAIELSTLFKREDTVGKMPVSRVIQVIILAFMLTGFIGYFANAKDVTQSHDIYNKISDIEPIVNYTQINEREEYNPVTNVTGWTKPYASDIYIPTTDKPNKYIISPAVVGYTSRDNHIDFANAVYSHTNLVESKNWYQHDTWSISGRDYDWGAFILRKVTDNNTWGGIDTSSHIYSYIDTFGFDQIDLNGWNQWTDGNGNDWNKDYNPDDMESPSVPYYLGGYGYGQPDGYNTGTDVGGYYDRMHCNMVVQIYSYLHNDDNTYTIKDNYDNQYASDPKHYLMLYRIDTSKWSNGEIIGVQKPDATKSDMVFQEGLYGIYSADNGGSPSDVVNFTYNIKVHASPTYVWVYDQFTKLLYPAEYNETTKAWSKIQGQEGCRSLVYMQKSTGISDTADWGTDNVRWESVSEIEIHDYGSDTYGGIPLLRSFCPYQGKANYADPLDWVVINSHDDFNIKVSYSAAQSNVTKITAYVDDDKGKPVPYSENPMVLNPGQWVTLVASPKEGITDWEFKGWYVDNVGQAISTETTLRFTVPNQDMTLVAQAGSSSNPEVSLNFRWESTTLERPGTISGKAMLGDKDLVEGINWLYNGTSITVDAVQFPGYTFVNWVLEYPDGHHETRSKAHAIFNLFVASGPVNFTLTAIFGVNHDYIDVDLRGASVEETITDWHTLGSVAISYQQGDEYITEVGDGIHRVPKGVTCYIVADVSDKGMFVDWKVGDDVVSTTAKYKIEWPEIYPDKLIYTAEFRYQPGIAYWGNNESVTAVTFWAERGLRISAFHYDEKGGDYGSDSVYADVYWKIPDTYTMYQYYICTIDLAAMTWTCQGVITYTNTQEYTLSEHVYNMECCRTGTTDVVDSSKVMFSKFPKAPTEDGSSNFRSMRFEQLKQNEYDIQAIESFAKLHVYILKTIVETNPKGLLWGNPQFYLDYYLPIEFKHDDKPVSIGGVNYLKMQNNARTLIGGVVKYGDSFIINEKEFPIKDGMVIVSEKDGMVESYPFKGMAVVWRNVERESQTHMYLVFTEAKDKTVDLGYALFEEKGVVVNGKVLTSPKGLIMSGTGNWYFAGSVQDIQIEEYTSKQFDIASGLYQMNIQQSVLMFLGISLLGVAAVAYYTRTDIPFIGWVVVGGTAALALSFVGMGL